MSFRTLRLYSLSSITLITIYKIINPVYYLKCSKNPTSKYHEYITENKSSILSNSQEPKVSKTDKLIKPSLNSNGFKTVQ